MSFVDAHDFSVDLVLRVLGIPSSTYYDWRARRTAPSLRRREDEELLRLIDAIRGEHEFAATYGSPTCAGAGSMGRPGRTRVIRRHRICSGAISPPPHPTPSGSPTSRGS